MNEKIEEILEKPVHVRIAILAGVSLVLVGAYYFLFFQSLWQELTETTERVKALEVEISTKRGIVANLPKFEMEVARLDVELNKALKELPDKKEIEQLLARISDKARDAGLDIRLFQPMPEQLKDYYAEVPVEIQVGGTYHQVATFFDEVGHLARIVNLSQFDIKIPQGSQREDRAKAGGKKRKRPENAMQLQTSVVATSFRFLEESERPQQDDKKSRKRRGRGKKKKA